MSTINCPSCREGEHDSCYIIAEVNKVGVVLWCACWDEGHTHDRATNMMEKEH